MSTPTKSDVKSWMGPSVLGSAGTPKLEGTRPMGPIGRGLLCLCCLFVLVTLVSPANMAK